MRLYSGGNNHPGDLSVTFNTDNSSDFTGRIKINSDGVANTYGGVIKTVNTGSDKFAHITLGGADADSVINNTYMIGRGNAISDRRMSFHIPNAAQYSDTTQPKFLFASSGSDTLMTITASTGDVFVKGVGTFGPNYP